MTVVAVAGGTQGLGRSLVDQLVKQSEYKVLIFSRKPQPQVEKETGLPVIAVNYGDEDTIVETLNQNGVEILISTVNAMADVQPELTLMRAANRAKTRRYIPSFFGSFCYQEQHGILPTVKAKLDIREQLSKMTSLEYTVVYNGYFLGYYGNGTVPSYLQIVPAVIDMAHNAAAIPGSGNTPVVFTHTLDIAKFVVALLGVEFWPKESFIIGDKVTWNQFAGLAESVKGPFKISHDPVELLQTGQMTELPGQISLYPFFPKSDFQWLYSHFGLWFENGEFDLNPPQKLNDVFPDIKPMSVKDFLEQSWK
ncbi:hypothetical protein BKA56DRAFT_631571 [Ilyonectria sp. MPI-CAGE-AT-0026]|nr:hypothetical protein BKA56DRAFT_631571 [Ilyonectria sp. MPI-CAGE-AT-0026]